MHAGPDTPRPDRAGQDIAACKTELRIVAKTRRAAITPAVAQKGTQAIASFGLGFLDLAPATIVAGYAAIGGELDLEPLLARLHDDGVALALPVTLGKGQPLLFRSWCPGDSMGSGFLGIAEPLNSAPEVQPDVLLVPLLAFDDRGFRLGYGGGHFDRTLAALRNLKPLVAVGLAYDEQKLDAVPQDRYDQQLNWVLTPTGARRCGGGKS